VHLNFTASASQLDWVLGNSRTDTAAADGQHAALVVREREAAAVVPGLEEALVGFELRRQQQQQQYPGRAERAWSVAWGTPPG
jgi:hypothetical protein